MLRPFAPILLLIAFVVANAILLIGLSHFLSSHRTNPAKQQPYESGMPVIGNARQRFSVKFYLVAMLFILFDIEVVFLYPWAVVYRDMLSEPAMHNVILFAMVSFLGILFVGYLYALKKRAFDWKS